MALKVKHDQQFQLFDIVDMYELNPDIMCYACNKGFKCKRHPQRKMTDHMSKEREFAGLDRVHLHANQDHLKMELDKSMDVDETAMTIE